MQEAIVEVVRSLIPLLAAYMGARMALANASRLAAESHANQLRLEEGNRRDTALAEAYHAALRVFELTEDLANLEWSNEHGAWISDSYLDKLSSAHVAAREHARQKVNNLGYLFGPNDPCVVALSALLANIESITPRLWLRDPRDENCIGDDELVEARRRLSNQFDVAGDSIRLTRGGALLPGREAMIHLTKPSSRDRTPPLREKPPASEIEAKENT